jgi:hypothetical protein
VGAPASQIPLRCAFRVAISGYPETAELTADLLRPYGIPVTEISRPEGASGDFPGATLLLTRDAGWSVAPDSKRGILVAAPGESPAGEPALEPDLWIFSTGQSRETEGMGAGLLSRGGAGVLFSGEGWAAWESDNAVFGKSRGTFAPWTIVPREFRFPSFLAGLVFALIEELLGDDLFDKTSPRPERGCLEMRPLHLGAAVECGLAAIGASVVPAPGRELPLGRLRAQLRAWRGPEPQGWGRGSR